MSDDLKQHIDTVRDQLKAHGVKTQYVVGALVVILIIGFDILKGLGAG